MSHNEYVRSMLAGIEGGYRSVYSATEEIASYIHRQVESAKQDGYSEGYGEGVSVGRQQGYDEAMAELGKSVVE